MSAFRLDSRSSVARFVMFDTADVVAVECGDVTPEMVLAHGEEREYLEYLTVRFRGGGRVTLIASIAQCTELMEALGNAWVELYD